MPTDRLFTGQRLDSTGLYYYNARYYDPTIGRFISADTVVQDIHNPQTLNHYSYCLNNPLKYNDNSGHFAIAALATAVGIGAGVGAVFGAISYGVSLAATGNSFSWSEFGQSVAAGAVAGALCVVVPFFLPAGSGLAGVALTCVAGGVASMEGYLVGQGVETLISQLLNEPDRSSPNLKDVGTSFGLGILATFLGRFVAGGTSAIKDIGPISKETRNANVTALIEAFAANTTYTTLASMINYFQFDEPVDVGNGFQCWGFTDSGIPVISQNDPSSYSWEDWYGG